MKSIDILAIGEPLMEFSQVDREGERVYLQGHGGDTCNVAVAAARQGARAAYFTALGNDEFGRSFMDLWKREGIDASRVIVRSNAPTGIYFITHSQTGHAFSYYRSGSAASLVTPLEIPEDAIRAAKVLHVSGISQAISQSACDAIFHALSIARSSNTTIGYDPNLRLRLWPLERARATIHATMPLVDIAMPGFEDARQLTGLESPDEICSFYLDLGCRVVLLKLGAEGILAATKIDRRYIPGVRAKTVDATAAGDTFDGAFLAEWLRSSDHLAAATYANAAAALSTQGYGAIGPMPDRRAVEQFLRAA